MKLRLNLVLSLLMASAISPAYAAWGDLSYNPSPALYDEDVAAQFDTFGLISHILSGGVSPPLSRASQNFETGFASGQTINDWVVLGGTRVRFGFGEALSSVQWTSSVGAIDPTATAFGLSHPHGTYGNVEGVLDQPRNYVADSHYLTAAAGSPSPGYFVMQFEDPISFLSFAMIDYASPRATFSMTLWNGDDLNSLTRVADNGSFNENRTVSDYRLEGSFDYLVSMIPYPTPGEVRRTFSYAIVKLDTPDATVGFDNFTVGIAPVPEPETYSLMGLGLMGIAAKRRWFRRSSAISKVG
jgi:hypothetical protein